MTDSNSPAHPFLSEAELHFVEGEFQEALSILNGGFRADASYLPLYKLASAILKELGGKDEADLFDAVLREPDSYVSYFNLGFHFHDAQFFELAIAYLERAVALGPEFPEPAFELSECYGATFRIEEALQVLQNFVGQGDFWLDFRYFRLSLLSGDAAGVNEFLDAAHEFLEHTRAEEREVEIARKWVAALEESLERFNLLEDPPEHIREWQFIQYGSAILDFLQTGDEDQYIAGGRFVGLWGSLESERVLIDKLIRFIRMLDYKIERILIPDSRDARIFAYALGSLLEVPTEELNKEAASQPNTLILAARTTELGDFDFLAHKSEGQLLVAIDHCWTDTSTLTPDLIGRMTQYYRFPWEKADQNPDQLDIPAHFFESDERSEPEIALDMVRSDYEQDPAFRIHLDFYRTVRPFLKASPIVGERFPYELDSPVKGAFFT